MPKFKLCCLGADDKTEVMDFSNDVNSPIENNGNNENIEVNTAIPATLPNDNEEEHQISLRINSNKSSDTNFSGLDLGSSFGSIDFSNIGYIRTYVPNSKLSTGTNKEDLNASEPALVNLEKSSQSSISSNNLYELMAEEKACEFLGADEWDDISKELTSDSSASSKLTKESKNENELLGCSLRLEKEPEPNWSGVSLRLG